MRVPFTLTTTAPGSSARAGRLVTPHGVIQTPQFMPVGTMATVRAQRTESLQGAGATMLLANTWHLMQRPGLDVFAAMGGIQRFMGWGGSVLTDSGGFQVFSFGGNAAVSEDGVLLKSPASGRSLALTPESSVEAQVTIGSDIGMVLDHCVASTVPHAQATDAMHRTHRWALRSLAARDRADTQMGLFGIVQGACYADLRRESADFLTQHPFDGFAIGGLAVGETKAEREEFTGQVTAMLPAHLPRYLMGVGTPLDLLEGVHRGVDLFDCILPTSLAQHGRVFTSLGRIDIDRGVYRLQDRPLDPACPCEVCARYSRAYLHHLYMAQEPLAWTLLGLHNLHFWLGLFQQIRTALAEERFAAFYAAQREVLDRPDPEHPPKTQKQKRRKRPPTERGRWALHTVPAWGPNPAFTSIKDKGSGEVMHAVTQPEEEARRLYVEQPRLRALAAEPGAPLVVWDVGLGAGTNAVEVVRAWQEEIAAGKAVRGLSLVSFELDLDALRLAFANEALFPRLRHGGPAGILTEGRWSSKPTPEGVSISWQLVEGDFLATHAAAPLPDVVIYDPFSFKVDAPLWTIPTFTQLRSAFGAHKVALYTYSNSTAVRLALLMAGFFVADGLSTGPKSTTTVALTQPDGRPLLGRAFLDRWERSRVRWPSGLAEADYPAFEAKLRAHPQFG